MVDLAFAKLCGTDEKRGRSRLDFVRFLDWWQGPSDEPLLKQLYGFFEAELEVRASWCAFSLYCLGRLRIEILVGLGCLPTRVERSGGLVLCLSEKENKRNH